MSKPVFKKYQQNQVFLFPPSLDEMIAENHPVRVISDVIDKINIDIIINKYNSRGTSSYHPRMLLKILVFGYLNNIYSSRSIETAIKENIHFMWLAGMTQPDHHTINRFRSERLRNILREVFAQIVLLLVDSGHINLKEIYTDGTKIESAANRYTFVWGKSVKNNRDKIKQQLRDLWLYSQKVARQEMRDDTPPDFDKIKSNEIKATIEKIEVALKDKDVDGQITQKLKYARKHWPAALQKYTRQAKILGKRNSYSKTDTGATFMKMKEDHLYNAPPKPGYNVQVSTNNQFIVNYSLHPNPTDTKTLIPHLKEFKKLYNTLPEVQVTDAGYASEENYQYLKNKNIEAYIKPQDFDRKQKGNWIPKNPYSAEHLYYDEQKDIYICPSGQPMIQVDQFTEKNDGYKKTVTVYKAKGCKNCALKNVCHPQKGNRIIKISHNARQLKEQAFERLKTEKGIYYRKKRPVDVEPVFGNIKHNKKFKRFMLKGIDKVEIEWGLLSIAANLKKIAV